MKKSLMLAMVGLVFALDATAAANVTLTPRMQQKLESGTVSASSTANHAGTVSILSLVEDTMEPSCISYRLNGVCFWLYCHYGCYIRTSLSVTHYNPDAIVETISEDGTTPVEWLTGMLDSTYSSIGKMIMGFSLGTGIKRADRHSSVNAYDVNVYGNPALLVYRDIVGSMMNILAFCKSNVMPFQPYFVSKIDPDWRLGVGEGVLKILPSNFSRSLTAKAPLVVGSNEATTVVSFGDIYPRTSSVRQDNRYLGSMVIAQRAANIVGGSSALHIATDLEKTVTGYKTWAPKDIKEGDGSIAKWQRSYPRGDSASCKAFPISSTSTFKFDSSDYSETQNYLYTLWRRYECCKKRGSFIRRVTY